MITFSPSSFIAGVMLGLLLAGVWVLSDNQFFTSSSSSRDSRTGTVDRVSESDAISLTHQRAGSEVIVDSVTVPVPVWIAVREVQGDTLGNVLGAARVGGSRTTVSVPLLRATEPERSYAIELYRDDNEGVFDPAKNSVYVDFDTGTRVVVYFETVK